MITAEQLYKQANINPTDFGEEIVPATVTNPSQQRDLAIAHIEALILPGAVSEVSVPLMMVSRGSDLPLPLEDIVARYPDLEGDVDAQNAINASMQTLYDEAVTSYARSEINKQVSTNTKSYDEDSDQDRKQGDAKLQKLLDLVVSILAGTPDILPPENFATRPLPSVGVKTTFGW